MKWTRIVALAIGAWLCTVALAGGPEREATQARLTEGKALIEEKCWTVAGEKIYRTVPEVEGGRPAANETPWQERKTA